MKRLLILLMVFIAACTNSGDSTLGDVHYGDDGLVLEFLDTIPDDVYEDTAIEVAVSMENDGTFDLADPYRGQLSVVYDEFYFDLLSQSAYMNNIQLQGRNILRQKGEYGLYDLASLKVRPLVGSREHPTTSVFVNVCYPYETYFHSPVCIDTNIYSINLREQVCEVEDLTDSGQGAPVAITRVETFMIPVDNKIQPQFRITIENVGDGQLLSYVEPDDLEQACSLQEAKREDWNTLWIDAFLSNATLDCRPNPIRMFQDEGITVCSLPVENAFETSFNYLDSLQVIANYVYSSSISKEVTIRRISKYEIEDSGDIKCPVGTIEDDGQCVEKCSYCATNPGFADCDSKVDFEWSCSCTYSSCRTMEKAELCVQDYCPGTTYCCNQFPECKVKNARGITEEDCLCENVICPANTFCFVKDGEGLCSEAQSCDVNKLSSCLCEDSGIVVDDASSCHPTCDQLPSGDCVCTQTGEIVSGYKGCECEVSYSGPCYCKDGQQAGRWVDTYGDCAGI